MSCLTCSKDQIAILMLNSPNIQEYATYTTMINYLYSRRHGYNFIVNTCPIPEDLDKDYMWSAGNEYLFVWSKCALIKRYLPHYKYIVYIDSDAIFNNFESRIEDFISQHMTNDTIMLCAEDCVSEYRSSCTDENGVNGGALIVKNTPLTFELLNEWIPENILCEEWKYKHTREQACLNIIRRKKYENEIKILRNPIMGGSTGVFIKHLMATSADVRLSEFIKDFNKHLTQMGSTVSVPEPTAVVKKSNETNYLLIGLIFILIVILIIIAIYFLLKK